MSSMMFRTETFYPLGNSTSQSYINITQNIIVQIWLWCKTAYTAVFDIISDITTRMRIISLDIMSKPFY